MKQPKVIGITIKFENGDEHGSAAPITEAHLQMTEDEFVSQYRNILLSAKEFALLNMGLPCVCLICGGERNKPIGECSETFYHKDAA